ncbi:hypothetical protein D8W71_21285 [Rhodococcus sp. P1Y]|nr:hypothetical protein D8W71_21285 [Rhodococcus sp. P1Y]
MSIVRIKTTVGALEVRSNFFVYRSAAKIIVDKRLSAVFDQASRLCAATPRGACTRNRRGREVFSGATGSRSLLARCEIDPRPVVRSWQKQRKNVEHA